MKNRINKSNKTRFDYIARKLGLLGGVILAGTCILGGETLINIKKENQILLAQLNSTKYDTKPKVNNPVEEKEEETITLDDGTVIVVEVEKNDL